MARNGVMASRRWRSDSIGGLELSRREDDEVHVLAVDDSLVDRKVIEKLLKISSCKVTAVDSGIRALQLLGLEEEKSSSVSFHELKVDLIITDYCMPGMTGYDLLKKIKESSSFREIPVVIMSSENVMARIDRCLEEGAEDFIVKPVKLSDVKRLRDFMATRELRTKTEEQGKSDNFSKRKTRESCESCGDLSSSQPSILSSPTTLSPSFSPSPSPVLSIFSSSPPCSPSYLDSPTRRLKLSASD